MGPEKQKLQESKNPGSTISVTKVEIGSRRESVTDTKADEDSLRKGHSLVSTEEKQDVESNGLKSAPLIKKFRTRPLYNRKNSCFFNSALQMFMHIKEPRKQVVEMSASSGT